MRRGAMGLGAVVAVWMALAAGLTLSACVHESAQSRWPAGTSGGNSDFTTNVLPVYRLVTSETLIDTPSRLLVLQLRLAGNADASYTFTAQDLDVVLPDGTHARVFDRARAIELLRRTIIAEADFGYLQRPNHVPGGIAPPSREPLADMVASRLLTEGTFDASTPLQGYVVVDIGAARTSLDGAVVEVVAHRLPDSEPSRVAYQLADVPHAATTAP